jgi:hypothetical protein
VHATGPLNITAAGRYPQSNSSPIQFLPATLPLRSEVVWAGPPKAGLGPGNLFSGPSLRADRLKTFTLNRKDWLFVAEWSKGLICTIDVHWYYREKQITCKVAGTPLFVPVSSRLVATAYGWNYFWPMDWTWRSHGKVPEITTLHVHGFIFYGVVKVTFHVSTTSTTYFQIVSVS